MSEEVKIKKVYAFDNQGDFENLFRKYINAHHYWRHCVDENLSELKYAEKDRIEAALEFAEHCMFHTCVIPHIERSDVIVLGELKQHVNALRTCLEKL